MQASYLPLAREKRFPQQPATVALERSGRSRSRCRLLRCPPQRDLILRRDAPRDLGPAGHDLGLVFLFRSLADRIGPALGMAAQKRFRAVTDRTNELGGIASFLYRSVNDRRDTRHGIHASGWVVTEEAGKKKWPANRPLPEFGGGRKPSAEFTLTGARVDRTPLRTWQDRRSWRSSSENPG